MKPFLLFEHYESKSQREVSNDKDLIADLNLQFILKAMAKGDKFLYDTAKRVVLDSLTDLDTLTYRQNVLKDCINNPSVINRFYTIASTTLNEADFYLQYTQPNYARVISVSVKVLNSVGLLELLIVKLEELGFLIALTRDSLNSKGLNQFCSQLTALLTDKLFINIKQYIADLKSIAEGSKMIIGSGIGGGMKGAGHILRKISKASPKENSGKWFFKVSESNVIPLDNTSIANSAREIEDAGLIHILRCINHFNNNVTDFFEKLRYEAGFYSGCINLYSELSQLKAEISFPVMAKIDKRILIFQRLYDLSLFISEKKSPVCNDLSAADKNMFIITGANQGGKSTFVRSIGIAQVLMQCGLFVPAAFYSANVCDKIFTHFTREEDINMNSGKLDEELLRMNNIIDRITPDSLLVMNEPFATTTERDGSRIACDIVTALFELNVKVLFVTHLYEFSDFMYKQGLEKAIFLRAERNQNGSRTFCIKEGKPLKTSFSEDLFSSLIGNLRGEGISGNH